MTFNDHKSLVRLRRKKCIYPLAHPFWVVKNMIERYMALTATFSAFVAISNTKTEDLI